MLTTLKIIDWIQDHDQLWSDFVDYCQFNNNNLEKDPVNEVLRLVDEGEITTEFVINWLSEHEEAYKDFVNHFHLNSLSFLGSVITEETDLTRKEAIKKHKELNELARKAQDAYYNGPVPIMDDFSYDKIYDEIEKLEKEYDINDPSSVTQTAGIATKVEKGKEEVHPFPCLSQDKTKDKNELLKWLGDNEGTLSRKCDGLTIVAYFSNGKLVKAVTRGDGTRGTNVTEFAKTQKCFMNLNLDYKGDLIVRGEYLFTYKEFERINKSLPSGQVKYSNPRNLSSGNVNQLSMNIAKQRQGEFHVFEFVSYGNSSSPKTHKEELDWMKYIGLNVVEYELVNKNNLLDTLDKLEKSAKSLTYPTDGLVLRINNNETCKKLGYKGHSPNFSIAFKFKDDVYETHLKDIIFQASRTGRINPVAVFDEVDLDGAKTTKATLNNLSFIKQCLGTPYIGQKIGVIRSNMVIPTVVSADKKVPKNAKLIEIPKTCPSCGQPTKIRKDGIAEMLYCENPECIAKQSKSLERFASKSCMDIEGLSTKTIEDFVDAGFITKFSDFYKLDRFKDEIINRDGYGITSYNKMINSISKSKNVELYRFISALGIPNVSVSTAKDICNWFNNDLNAIRNADEDDFMNINGIGMAVAAPLVQYFENNKDEIDELLKYVRFVTKGKAHPFIAGTSPSSGNLNGLSFCFTGKLVTGKFRNREEFIDAVESNGGTWVSSVRHGLDYLVNNDINSTSTKNKKAKELNIKIISEVDFLNMIE